jgi:hypothetical protein
MRKGGGGVLMEGTGPRVQEVCTTKGWVQCSRIEEEGCREENRVESNGGHGGRVSSSIRAI